MANRGISRQDTQPPRNQKDPAVHQGPPELFRSGSPRFVVRLASVAGAAFSVGWDEAFAISSEKADARGLRLLLLVSVSESVRFGG